MKKPDRIRGRDGQTPGERISPSEDSRNRNLSNPAAAVLADREAVNESDLRPIRFKISINVQIERRTTLRQEAQIPIRALPCDTAEQNELRRVSALRAGAIH